MKSLVPCPSCGRHVRVSEAACPFCATALPTDLAARAIPSSSGRLKRAAAFAFTATLTLAGCSDDPTPAADSGAVVDAGGSDAGSQTTDSGVRDAGPGDDGGAMALYGGPPVDAGSADAGPRDDGGAMALYGGPPVDAGPSDAGPDDDGGSAALYGAPADAGPGVRYGAPPPPDSGV
ncbi:MAG: hypothetical protein JNK72_22435 [Myxococcales bacterium]|nr:hypothetical protein [Myxococcales bacterium]